MSVEIDAIMTSTVNNNTIAQSGGQMRPATEAHDQEGGVTDRSRSKNSEEILRDKMLRALAEADNARKHAMKARKEGHEEGVAAAVRELIDVLDNLDRALAASKALSSEPDRNAALKAGVAATRDLMLAGLRRLNVEKVASVNEEFNPEFCEAVSKRVVADLAPGAIAEVVQPGYRIGNRLIRPARVVIAEKGDSELRSCLPQAQKEKKMKDRAIKKEEWSSYFENLSGMLAGKRILIEIASPSIGDQIEANWAPLTGVTYDSKDDLVDVAVEHLNHIIQHPKSVHVHHDEQHLAAIEIRQTDGTKHILKFKEPFLFARAVQ